MVTSGAPHCPACGADLGWGESVCPYCGTNLLPRKSLFPGGILSGPFPRQLRIERRGFLRAEHALYDGTRYLGRFTQSWPAGVRFFSPQGYRYRTERRRLLRLVLHWNCGPQLVAWVEQSRLWLRRYRLQYGGAAYWLVSSSPMSLAFTLRDEAGNRLAEIHPPSLLRPPSLTVYSPLALELLALAYATALVFWRQAASA